jgi:group I intron endonuclease
MASGVYCWYNTVNEKIYIGSSKDIEGRKLGHEKHLREGRHGNKHLQAAWNCYSEAVFLFVILLETDDLIAQEQHYIDMMKATDSEYGYNICPIAYSTSGCTMSEESRAKISASLTGKRHSEELKAKLSIALKGRKKSEETIANMKEGWKNREHAMSEEQKIKISSTLKGNKNCAGRKLSPETKAKIGLAQRRTQLAVKVKSIAKFTKEMAEALLTAMGVKH